MLKGMVFGNKIEKNILEEEALQTPSKTILMNMLRNKLAMLGFFGFIAILLFCFIGAYLNPIMLTYTEHVNSNIRPSRNFLSYPSTLNDKNVIKIVSGVSFSLALDDEGDLHIWGTESNLLNPGVTDLIMEIPEEVRNAHIVDIESGGSHILTLDIDGNFLAWGHHGQGQTTIPDLVLQEMEWDFNQEYLKIAAMTRWSAILGDSGYVYLWGSMQAEHSFGGLFAADRAIDIVGGDNHIVLLHRDNTVSVVGQAGTEVMDMVPEEIQDGSVEIVQIASTNRNGLALDTDGKLWLWGSPEYWLSTMPEFSGNVVHIDGAYKNFVIVTDQEEIIVWGSNELKQLDLPKNLQGTGTGTTKVFSDYFQFYAMDDDGNILGAWGNKGYRWGSDQFGRDIFTRTMHGGRISLTVGIMAVVISTFLAILVGLTSGFFGGWVDHLLMRITDVFYSLPFLPIVVVLNFIIGHNISAEGRVYLLMCLLGVLGWMGLARLIRAQLLLEREKDFVLAARALGIKQRGIMVRHILPNVINMVIVSVTLGYAVFILQEAVFSFLGFGVPEPTPSWGNMLNTAMESVVIQHYWWRWVIPSLFVVAAAFSVNLVGDGLRDAMDPRANER